MEPLLLGMSGCVQTLDNVRVPAGAPADQKHSISRQPVPNATLTMGLFLSPCFLLIFCFSLPPSLFFVL